MEGFCGGVLNGNTCLELINPFNYAYARKIQLRTAPSTYMVSHAGTLPAEKQQHPDTEEGQSK